MGSFILNKPRESHYSIHRAQINAIYCTYVLICIELIITNLLQTIEKDKGICKTFHLLICQMKLGCYLPRWDCAAFWSSGQNAVFGRRHILHTTTNNPLHSACCQVTRIILLTGSWNACKRRNVGGQNDLLCEATTAWLSIYLQGQLRPQSKREFVSDQ